MVLKAEFRMSEDQALRVMMTAVTATTICTVAVDRKLTIRSSSIRGSVKTGVALALRLPSIYKFADWCCQAQRY